MTHSISEVSALSKLAARGAGYSWGLAEDAAKAVGWLCTNDMDGCEALAGLLIQVDRDELAALMPNITGQVVTGAQGSLCPISAGVALADRAHVLEQHEFRLTNLIAPLLLIPFAASIARRLERVVTLRVDDLQAITDGRLMMMVRPFEPLARDAVMSVGGSVDTPRPHRHRVTPSDAALQTLSTFAHRTYAPATEESRLKGAGAGLSDKD